MTFVSIASILVAVIAAFSAVASQRAAAKASVLNTQTTSRVDMEREAYERARNFDTETIRRQDDELEELRGRVRQLEAQNAELRRENDSLERHVQRLEGKVGSLEYDLTVVKRDCEKKHNKAPPDP